MSSEVDPQDLAVSPDEARELLRRLRLHEMELEAQNEELRRAQEALERSRARYVDLYDQAPVGYLTLTAQGTIHEANLKAAGLLQMARDALTGLPLWRFILPADRNTYHQHHQELLRTGEPLSCEVRLAPGNDPPWTWVCLSLALAPAGPAEDPAPAGPLCRVVLGDITDLKVGQEKLAELNRTLEERVRQRTAQVQDLYDQAPCGYHSLDRYGNFLLINQTELQWLGYSLAELIGQPAARVLAPESAATFAEDFERLKETGRLTDLEREFVRKDGRVLTLALNAVAVYGPNGRFEASRATVFDVTERKLTEAALRRANAELARALAAKDAGASG